jgi:hypothetical protein
MENLILTKNPGIYKMVDQIKKSLITSLILGGIFIALIVIYFLFVLVLMAIGFPAESTGYVVGMMPFINGAFHADFGHLFGNLLFLFVFLIPEVNQGYNLKKLFWTSFFLSTLYIPIFILGISLPAVGSSGVFYFLIGRFMFSRQATLSKVFAYGAFFLLIGGDVFMITSGDGVAHIFHAMCAVIGVLTVTKLNKIIPSRIHNLIA